MKIGAMGGILPPVESVTRGATRAEERGYDSLWWPDHLMGWYPDSLWTPDLGKVAAHQANPHVFLDAVAAMAVAGTSTQQVTLGTAVTDSIRRPPPVLAQQFLSLHHLTRGRAILGIGAGELENVGPYGFDYSRQVSRLGEGLEIVRLLWGHDEPISYEGEFWRLQDAVLGLGPYQGTYPPIWLAAHGPRMRELCGRYGDGWIPIGLSVEGYRDSLAHIREVARSHGRDPDAIEAASFAYCVVAEDHEAAHRLLDAPLVKAYALVLPASAYERHGHRHPLGEDFYGLTELVPTRLDRESALAAIDAVPFEVVHEFIAHGTPDDLADVAHAYAEVGMSHFVPWNVSFFADWDQLAPSFRLLAEFVQIVHARTSPMR